MRKIQFVENEYYHIYNRGVDKRDVFLDDSDYLRFLKSMKEFNAAEPIGSLYEKSFRDNLETKSPSGDLVSKKIVEIVAYCLNPNHYHLILRQLVENGISKFLLKLSSGYTTHFNRKYKRSGALFQGTFKAAQIKSGNLLYLSAYVNCNAEVHGIAKAADWRWSSFSDYLGKTKYNLCDSGVIMSEFSGGADYEDFAMENAEAAKEKKADEKVVFE